MTVSAPVTLSELEALGCSLNAGWLDHYNGMTHTRVALVTPTGDLVYEKGGEMYSNGLRMAAFLAAHGGSTEPAPDEDLDPMAVLDAMTGDADQ